MTVHLVKLFKTHDNNPPSNCTCHFTGNAPLPSHTNPSNDGHLETHYKLRQQTQNDSPFYITIQNFGSMIIQVFVSSCKNVKPRTNQDMRNSEQNDQDNKNNKQNLQVFDNLVFTSDTSAPAPSLPF